jgi:DNA polymerase III sliding clamp (beta) subunit (PCNA family)
MDTITSKTSTRPELQGVYFSADRMVATDSFRLLEVKKPIALAGEPRVIKAKGFRGRGIVAVADADIITDSTKLLQGERMAAEYPEYEKVFDGLSEQPRFSMVVNAKYLAELLAEVDAQAGTPFQKIRLDFFESMKPLLITATGETPDKQPVCVRALLSPMTG